MQKYTLYSWYAWDFGKWVPAKSSDTYAELLAFAAAQHVIFTYKIVNNITNYEVVRRVAAACWRRPGMVMP